MLKPLPVTFRWVVLLACLVAAGRSGAQNLVINGDFEAYNVCPYTTGMLDFSPSFTSFPSVKNWVTPNTGSSDYFNTCSTNPLIRAPKPLMGYQQPHSGNGYAGLYTAVGITGFRPGGEHISTKLPEPLKKDERYCMSFWVSTTAVDIVTNQTKIAVNSVGAFISDTLPTRLPTPSMDPQRFIQNDTNRHLDDTSRWYEIQGTYIAKGGEQWITIGQFFDGPMPAFSYLTTGSLNQYLGYIYVDDVSLNPVGSSYTTRRIPYCDAPLQLSANAPTGPYRWSTGDTGRSITVNAPGTYTCLTPGTCGNMSDTIVVLPVPTSDTVIESEIKVCSAGAYNVKLSVPLTGSRYRWSTGATTPEIIVTAPGVYRCDVLSDCRIYPVRITVTKEFPATPVLRDTMICQGVEAPVLRTGYDDLLWYTSSGAGPYATQPLINTGQPGRIRLYASRQLGSCSTPRIPINIDIQGRAQQQPPVEILRCAGLPTTLKIGDRLAPGDSYIWSTGATSYLIPMPAEDGMYTREVINICGSITDTFHVRSVPCNDCISFPNAFTPNGDGHNDVFSGMLRCPANDFLLRVYNRWGQMVFVTSRIDGGWDGMHNGKPADVGTYMYQCTFKSSISGGSMRAQGDVTLVR